MPRPYALRLVPRGAAAPCLLVALLAATGGCGQATIPIARAPSCAAPESLEGDQVLVHDAPSLSPGHSFSCGAGGWTPAYVVSWKPASTGMATVDAFRFGSRPGVLIERLAADCSGGPVCVNAPSSDGSTHATFNVVAGHTYLLALGSPDYGDTSTIQAHLQVQPNTASACRAPALVDLDAVGVRNGSVVTYNTVAPRPAAGSLLVPPPGCTSHGADNQMAFRYTPRSSGRLFVSTDGSTPAFDTVAWVLDRCDATGSAFGCDDNSGVLVRTASRLATPRAVTAGVPVYVVVSGITSTTGALHVTVGEQAPVTAGGACDPSGLASFCGDGGRCLARPGATSQGVCAADGALGGRCRAVAPACDAGALCGDAAHHGGTDPALWRCLAVEPPGMACDPYGQQDVCADGTSCVIAGSQELSGSRCLADGANGSRCRAAGTVGAACDPGLACVGAVNPDGTRDPGSRCRPALADGAPCDARGLLTACLAPSRCAVAGVAAGTCQPPAYVEQVLVNPVFVDACGGNGVHLAVTDRYAGHATAPLTVPFPLRFTGVSFNQLWPSVNGYALLGNRAPADGPGGARALPSDAAPLLAPLWQNLSLRAAPVSDLCARVVGVAPHRQQVLEWSDAQSVEAPSSHLTFEVVLTEDSAAVDFLYGHLDGAGPDAAPHVNGTAAGVGLQTAPDAAPAVHLGAVSTATGIRFVPR